MTQVMEITHASIYQLGLRPPRELRIMTMTSWPRNISARNYEIGLWIKATAPAPALVAAWLQHEEPPPPAWNEFLTRYHLQLLATPTTPLICYPPFLADADGVIDWTTPPRRSVIDEPPLLTLATLARRCASRYDRMVLICWEDIEKPGIQCHRVFLAQLVQALL